MTVVPHRSQPPTAQEQLVLSLFPGIDLLGRGFEAVGFCVTRGPDLIFGSDIRDFHPPHGRFDGIIGGSPCQDFSVARRGIPPTGNGLEMIGEFIRVVTAVRPRWWLLENVPGVPDVQIESYSWQRLDLFATDFGLPQRRLRHIQFGSRDGYALVIPRGATKAATEPAAMASDTDTRWQTFCQRQGLPADFDLPAYKEVEKRRAVGNAVPFPMAKGLATAVANQMPADTVTLCECRCGRPVTPPKRLATGSCRSRAFRRRHRSH